MVTYRVLKLGILVVFVFILFTGLTASSLAQEETTEPTRIRATVLKKTSTTLRYILLS